jgi:four helix bundle protein
MNTFEELNGWKKSREIRLEIRRIVNRFPKEEKFNLVTQLIRASRSISANIAEGHGRFNYQENVRFCRIARGSLMEVLDHIIVAMDEEYITVEEFSNLKKDILLCNKIMNGYISYLLKNKAESEYLPRTKSKNQNNNYTSNHIIT